MRRDSKNSSSVKAPLSASAPAPNSAALSIALILPSPLHTARSASRLQRLMAPSLTPSPNTKTVTPGPLNIAFRSSRSSTPPSRPGASAPSPPQMPQMELLITRRLRSMNRHDVLALLEAVRAGALAPQSALERLSTMPYEDAGFARIDHHRGLRLGIPEVIYAEGKSPEHVAEISARTAPAGSDVLATRVSEAAWQAISARVPAAQFHTT